MKSPRKWKMRYIQHMWEEECYLLCWENELFVVMSTSSVRKIIF
jgi:hypothetical protein